MQNSLTKCPAIRIARNIMETIHGISENVHHFSTFSWESSQICFPISLLKVRKAGGEELLWGRHSAAGRSSFCNLSFAKQITRLPVPWLLKMEFSSFHMGKRNRVNHTPCVTEWTASTSQAGKNPAETGALSPWLINALAFPTSVTFAHIWWTCPVRLTPKSPRSSHMLRHGHTGHTVVAPCWSIHAHPVWAKPLRASPGSSSSCPWCRKRSYDFLCEKILYICQILDINKNSN